MAAHARHGIFLDFFKLHIMPLLVAGERQVHSVILSNHMVRSLDAFVVKLSWQKLPGEDGHFQRILKVRREDCCQKI